jgi:hypothetical protein
MIITREKALAILKNHGWTPEAQTASFQGVLVKEGFSFYENLGIKEEYRLKDVLLWLGY